MKAEEIEMLQQMAAGRLAFGHREIGKILAEREALLAALKQACADLESYDTSNRTPSEHRAAIRLAES